MCLLDAVALLQLDISRAVSHPIPRQNLEGPRGSGAALDSQGMLSLAKGRGPGQWDPSTDARMTASMRGFGLMPTTMRDGRANGDKTWETAPRRKAGQSARHEKHQVRSKRDSLELPKVVLAAANAQESRPRESETPKDARSPPAPHHLEITIESEHAVNE